MNYLEQLEKYYIEKISKSGQSTQFENSFERAIYFLIIRFLNSEENGPRFIEIPVIELGAKDHIENYVRFSSFILQAASEYVLSKQFLKVLPKEKILVGDYFIGSKGKVKLMVAKNRVKVVSENDNSSILVKPDYKAVKLLKEYDFNTQNGQRAVSNYLEWIMENIESTASQVLGTNHKILIISHLFIENSNSFKRIPSCTIKENGSFIFNCPIDPIIFLTRDHSNVKVRELVREKFFETIIMFGDKNISVKDEWAVSNGYFKKVIYIGNKSPYSHDVYIGKELPFRFYPFSFSEIHHFYGIRNKIKFENKVFNNSELERLIQTFYDELKNTDSNLKFDLSIFFDLTAKISEVQIEWFLDFFDQKILIQGNDDLDYTTLKERYQDLLNYFQNEGNGEKIVAYREIKNKNFKKAIIPVVLNKFEVSNLSDQLQIQESKILTVRNFGRKLRSSKILESKNDLIFVFFSIPSSYEGSLVMALDQYNVPGIRIFLSSSKNDSRFNKILAKRNAFNKIRLENQVREEITGIPFNADEIFEIIPDNTVLETIDDIELNEFSGISPKNKYQRDFYKISLTGVDDKEFELAGRIVHSEDKELIDLSEVKKGDEIIFYQHDSKIFESIWELKYSGFSEDINKYSEAWKEVFSKIVKQTANLKELHTELKNVGLKTSLESLRRLSKSDDSTIFPRLDTLRAVKFFCDRNGKFINDLFIKEFQSVLKAKKAVELRKKLGNRLSLALLEKYCGFEVEDLEFDNMMKEQSEIFDRAIQICIIKGEVNSIKKSKNRS